MRIETFNAAATSNENEWMFETMAVADTISHLEGLAEIDVIEDKVTPIPPPPGWTDELYARRIIRGSVRQRLFIWEERHGYFGADVFLGGICLPEEDARYMNGQASVNYDEQANILEISLTEISDFGA